MVLVDVEKVLSSLYTYIVLLIILEHEVKMVYFLFDRLVRDLLAAPQIFFDKRKIGELQHRSQKHVCAKDYDEANKYVLQDCLLVAKDVGNLVRKPDVQFRVCLVILLV